MGGLLPFAGPALKLGAGAAGLIASSRARKQANQSAASQVIQQYNPYANGNPLAASASIQSAANEQEAQALEAQGLVAQQEAGQAATQKAREVSTFEKNQAVQFGGSGVSVVGSPSALAVLNNTRVLGKQETDAIAARGAAQRGLYDSKAAITRSEGMAALLGNQSQWDANALNFTAQQELARIPAQRQTGGPSVFASLLGSLGDAVSGIAGAKTKGTKKPGASPLSTGDPSLYDPATQGYYDPRKKTYSTDPFNNFNIPFQ